MNINKTLENLNKNGIHTHFVQHKSDVIPKLKELITKGATVNVGGSMSLFECGVIDFLRSGDYVFQDRYAPNLSPADILKVFEQAHGCDVYLCSSNAITENGELYNVDGNSNRVSAIAHGPKAVIMIVSVNKIVKNIDEAINRVKTIAAPKNCVRLSCETYCREAGKCQSLLLENPSMTDGCNSAGRICCNYLVSVQQRQPGRITVVFVGEELGY